MLRARPSHLPLHCVITFSATDVSLLTELRVPKNRTAESLQAMFAQLLISMISQIKRLPGILLLDCNLSAKTYSVFKVVSVMGEEFIPTSLGTSLRSDFLWMVMGVSNLPGFNSLSLARVRVISGLTKCNSESRGEDYKILEDKEVPCGEKLLQQLQGSLSIDKDVFSAAAEAVKTSMRNLLIKKQYTFERRDFRKRGRNDKKGKR